jgi:hypothetical protein
MARPFLLQMLQVFMNSFLLCPVFRLKKHNCPYSTILLGVTPDAVLSKLRSEFGRPLTEISGTL